MIKLRRANRWSLASMTLLATAVWLSESGTAAAAEGQTVYNPFLPSASGRLNVGRFGLPALRSAAISFFTQQPAGGVAAAAAVVPTAPSVVVTTTAPAVVPTAALEEEVPPAPATLRPPYRPPMRSPYRPPPRPPI